MSKFKLGDEVYFPSDAAPFIVVGLRENSTEIKGDFSGGTQAVIQTAWVDNSELKPFDKAKMVYYLEGKPFKNGKPI